MERARRLRTALTRISEGEYGLCSECGAAIPSRRLLAVPDATTCVACQSRLERVGASTRGPQDDVELGRERSA
jgi:phage/conjugal plasmid C-4 type zinc finger TraR family protein